MLARIEQFADVMHDSKLQIRKVHAKPILPEPKPRHGIFIGSDLLHQQQISVAAVSPSTTHA